MPHPIFTDLWNVAVPVVTRGTLGGLFTIPNRGPLDVTVVETTLELVETVHPTHDTLELVLTHERLGGRPRWVPGLPEPQSSHAYYIPCSSRI
jgi:hypothetical protein